MATLSQWLRDWRSIADGLAEPGREPITMTHDGRTYEVLIVATYEPGMEDGYVVAKTPSRDFDGKVALYSWRNRDTGLMRIITNKARHALCCVRVRKPSTGPRPSRLYRLRS